MTQVIRLNSLCQSTVKQCYELADDGIIDEEELDEVFARIAEYIREGSDYKKGSINKVTF